MSRMPQQKLPVGFLHVIRDLSLNIPWYIGPPAARRDRELPAPPRRRGSIGAPVGRMARGARKTFRSVVRIICLP